MTPDFVLLLPRPGGASDLMLERRITAFRLDDDRRSRIRPVAAYFIVDVAWRDDTARQQYVASFGATLTPYGGRVVLAGPAEVVEGDWHPDRLVLLEFDNVERAHAWYHSAEYEQLKHFRHQGADSKMVLVATGYSG
jgi:uncharacterized protein (DUF1330 family)